MEKPEESNGTSYFEKIREPKFKGSDEIKWTLGLTDSCRKSADSSRLTLLVLDSSRLGFSDTSVKLPVSSAIFDTALLLSDEACFSDYGTEQLQALVDFYGIEVTTVTPDRYC